LTAPALAPDREIVGRAERALDAIADAGVDLLLTGHYHRASSRNVTSYHLTTKRTILVSEAGTAISTRLRGEVNSYNFIRVDHLQVSCEQRDWEGDRFATASTQRYTHFDGHWSEHG
jgi:hypothetical protein